MLSKAKCGLEIPTLKFYAQGSFFFNWRSMADPGILGETKATIFQKIHTCIFFALWIYAKHLLRQISLNWYQLRIISQNLSCAKLFFKIICWTNYLVIKPLELDSYITHI